MKKTIMVLLCIALTWACTSKPASTGTKAAGAQDTEHAAPAPAPESAVKRLPSIEEAKIIAAREKNKQIRASENGDLYLVGPDGSVKKVFGRP